jgi:neutral amino acid transport system ATP-binding protein
MPGEWVSGVAAEPGVAKPDPIFVADGVRKRFGGLIAVDVDHLEIQRGSITGLIGPNGAGKTTLFNLLTGFADADGGVWEFEGRRLEGAHAHRIARAGMVRTFQLTKALAKMSVLDNMKVGAPAQRGERLLVSLFLPAWRAEEVAVEERARDWLDHFNLLHMAKEYAGTLSGGQRKLLELARALMTEPQFMLLDEPVAGVNPALVQSLLDHIRGLRDQGRTVLFVEHDMDVVMGISDWVICMAQGKVIAEGPPQSVAANPLVVDAYLGTHRAEGMAT